MSLADDREIIEAAYADLDLLPKARAAVERTIASLDGGQLRVAEKRDGDWIVNEWTKQAISLYFRLAEVRTMDVGPFEYHDKIPPKRNLAATGVRVVPPGVIRYGAYCESGVIVMPGYVNIGAWVGSGSLIDTWATVGSCAQIGRNVHISGGVGIGGVLEPPKARPVIVEDGAFVGSRCILVEGVVVEERAVLGANVTVTASTPIIDVTGPEPTETRGRIRAGSVVLPGTRPKDFPAGQFQLQCALIVGERSESTDAKTSLNDAIRTFEVPV